MPHVARPASYTVSEQTLKEQQRRLLRQHHPDRMANRPQVQAPSLQPQDIRSGL
jgi:hypothetical protein